MTKYRYEIVEAADWSGKLVSGIVMALRFACVETLLGAGLKHLRSCRILPQANSLT